MKIEDGLGKVCFSGICSNSFNVFSDPLAAVTVRADWQTVTSSSEGCGYYQGYHLSGVSLVSPTVLTVNYYNDYTFLGENGIPVRTDEKVCYDMLEGFGKQYTASVQGLLTGTLTAQLTGQSSISPAYLYSVMYYDNQGRLIQTKSSNHLNGGIEKEYIAYDFIGQVTRRKHVHMATGKTTQTEVYTYTYDHTGQLLATTHQLNTNPETTLAENTYDELGRLESITRNEQDSLKTNYTYNVRSWMKSVTSPLFTQTLYYNDKRTNSNTNIPSYTSNISAMDWKVTAENIQRGYDFTYDALSRLTGANYLENNAASTRFGTSYAYDKHGNMLSLLRSGNQGTTTYGVIDHLTLAYSGNQLVKVEDTAVNPTLSMSMDFRNGADQAVEYTYDKNGNQIKDLNKGIINTEYNILNLPRRITFNHTNNPVNEYVYSAAGAKLSVTHRSSTEKRTDYVGNMIYENGSLKRILVEGGYIEDGVYHFYIQDYLGNNRVVAKQDGTPIQTNHYYPFGMSFAESLSPDKQPNKYNGKELDTENGLNLYDYTKRMTDVLFGRFTSVDPMAEKYYTISPYVYCKNNPVNALDPDGQKVVFVNGYLGFGSPKGNKDYWNYSFIGGAQSFFNDNTTPYFTDVKHGKLSWASGRYSKGYEYAKENYASLVDGMKKGETFKLVSHSMGGAFAAGMQEYLEEQGWSVDYSVFINTYQSGSVKTKKDTQTFIIDYQNTNDPVLFWFDLNLGLGEIKNADVKIRVESENGTQYIHKGPISSGEDFWKELQKMIDEILNEQ